MEQCGFQVNLLAKGLKQNRTNIIIIFLDKHNDDYMNLWRNEMLKHLFRYTSKIGLKVIVSPSDCQGFREDETDGFYLLSSGIADGAILLEYMAEDQRICYLTNDENIHSTKLRVKGFLAAVPNGRVFYGVKDAKSAYEQTRELLTAEKERIDCIFTNGDNLPINEDAYPALSSLWQDFDTLAERCIAMLQSLLEKTGDMEQPETKQIFLPSMVIERESTVDTRGSGKKDDKRRKE